MPAGGAWHPEPVTIDFSPAQELDFEVAVVVADAAEVLGTYGDPDAVHPWASCTKLVTALATLVAVDRHLVDLDAPAGPEGATVRHLLAHASGLAFDSATTLSAPGRRRTYSNRGFEVLADHVAAAVGTPFAEWAQAAVLTPLGMAATTFEGSPAAGACGPARDLARLGQEMLVPTLITADLHREATTVVFPGLSGVLPGYGRQEHNDWGLGFEIRDHKDPHWTGATSSPQTYGHFGQAGSFLWVDPAREVTAAFLGAERFSAKHRAVWPRLTDAILASAP